MNSFRHVLTGPHHFYTSGAGWNPMRVREALGCRIIRSCAKSGHRRLLQATHSAKASKKPWPPCQRRRPLSSCAQGCHCFLVQEGPSWMPFGPWRRQKWKLSFAVKSLSLLLERTSPSFAQSSTNWGMRSVSVLHHMKNLC